MPEIVIHTRASRASVIAAVHTIPQEVCGSSPTAVTTLTNIGITTLEHIRKAFIVKSRGGTDEAGDRWEPLAPSTIAARRSKNKTKKPKSKPTVSLKGTAGSAERRIHSVIKGSKGKGSSLPFDKYDTSSLILQDTGLLLSSLTPFSSAPEQVFRVEPGEVTIGTNRKWAVVHHHGIPGKLPQRRLWPILNSWPTSWWSDILGELQQGVVDITAEVVRNIE